MATVQHGPLNLDAVPSAVALRIAVVVSEWNAKITENLYEGARTVLEQKGCSDIQRIDVPGSFELIYGCKAAMDADFGTHFTSETGGLAFAGDYPTNYSPTLR